MSGLFKVEDPDELHALVVLLLEAKFKAFPDNRPHLDDPLVACLCERAVEAFTAANPDQARALYGGRPSDSIWPLIRRKLDDVITWDVWKTWSPEQRSDYVRVLLSPFAASSDVVTDLLADGSAEEVLSISSAYELDRYLEKELGYCGNAAGNEAVELLRDVLRILRFKGRPTSATESWRQAYEQLMDKLCFDAVPGLATWFLYMLNGRGFVDHAFNVTDCSITPKGKRLLDAIERYYKPEE